MIWSEPLKIVIRKTDNDNIAILIIILKTTMMMTTIKLNDIQPMKAKGT